MLVCVSDNDDHGRERARRNTATPTLARTSHTRIFAIVPRSLCIRRVMWCIVRWRGVVHPKMHRYRLAPSIGCALMTNTTEPASTTTNQQHQVHFSSFRFIFFIHLLLFFVVCASGCFFFFIVCCIACTHSRNARTRKHIEMHSCAHYIYCYYWFTINMLQMEWDRQRRRTKGELEIENREKKTILFREFGYYSWLRKSLFFLLAILFFIHNNI